MKSSAFRGCGLLRVALAIAVCGSSAVARPAPTISLHTSGGDPLIGRLQGPASAPFAVQFDANAFFAARLGVSPIAITPDVNWVASIPGSPAVWINPTASGSSALYAFRFTVPALPTGPAPSAILTLRYAVDNQLGGGPNVGVYLNEQPIPCPAPAGGFNAITTHRCNVLPLLVAGDNILYINQTNTGGPSGLLLDAKLQLFSSVIEVPGDVATIQEAHDLAITGQDVVVTAAELPPTPFTWSKRVNLRGRDPGGVHRIRYTNLTVPQFREGSTLAEVSDVVFALDANPPAGTFGVFVTGVSPITFNRVQFLNQQPNTAATLIIGFGTVQLRNCVFVSAPGVISPVLMNGEGATLSIDSCTFVGGERAVGVGELGMNINIRNSILHVPGAGSPIPNPQFHAITVQNSLITNGFPGPGNINADPRFISGTFIPSKTSPCIDAGSNAAAPSGPDFTGSPRINRTIAGVPTIDMGAVEATGALCAGDTNGDGQVDGADLSVLLSRFGQSCQ